MTAALQPTTKQAETLSPHKQIALPPGSWVLSILMPALVVMAAMVLLGVLAHQFQTVTASRNNIKKLTDGLRDMNNVRDQFLHGIAGIRQYVDTGDIRFLQMFDEAQAALPNQILKFDTGVLNAQEAAQLDKFDVLHRTSMQLAKNIRVEYELHHQVTPALSDNMGQLIVNMNESREVIGSFQRQLGARIFATENDTAQQLRTTGWYALAIGITGGIVALILSGLLLRYMRQRTEMAHELQVSSELWRGTLGNLAQGLAVYDSDRRLAFFNEQFERLMGIPIGTLKEGMPYQDVVRAALRTLNAGLEAEIAQADSNFTALCSGQSLQHERCRLDGLIVRIDVRPITSNYYMLALSDITLIRNSEATARDQAMRLAAIMDNVPDGIITIQPSGTIESWSEGAQRIFGYSAAKIVGNDFKQLLAQPQSNGGDELQFNPETSDSLLGQRLELLALHQNGHDFPIDLVLSRVQLAGQVMLVGIVRDITERRRVEQLKTEFISTVSHELRTPLTSIRGSLGLLTDKLVGELPAKARQLVSIALQNCERLTRLINDILDLEKAEAGRMKLELSPQSLCALAAQAIEANRAYGERHQVRFELLNKGMDLPVLADADRIMQVLANLLSNAIKHSPQGGEVSVQVQSHANQMRVTVYDQGPGIPLEFQSRIFSRFAQADVSDARQKSGSGLGLVIAKSLVEQHGGQIGFIDSAIHNNSDHAPTRGAAFWFELPIPQSS